MQGATRLDRLLILLESGSSPATRQAAAEQIGEVQKYHPYDLQSLLHRVQPFLFSKSWETRVAAGEAIEAIARNVPPWKPKDASNGEVARIKEEEKKIKVEVQVKDEPLVKEEVLAEGCTTADSEASSSLQFSKFDINRVLDHGLPLLSSGGQEFEDVAEGSEGSLKERLAAQRKSLMGRLGISGSSRALADMSDMLPIDDDDLVSHTTKEDIVKRRVQEEEAKVKGAAVMAEVDNMAGLSARERNRLKRKTRLAASGKEKDRGGISRSSSSASMNRSTSTASMHRSSSSSSVASDKEPAAKRMKTVVTEQPQNDSKVIVEAVSAGPGPVMGEEADEWPFDLFCEELCHKLFDPCWEVRHGASIGLREVWKLHASGGGIAVDATSDKATAQNEAWLEDHAIRILCVFALDRFGDFVSDQVVAPVRETCAQALGALVKHMSRDLVMSLAHCVLKLFSRPLWEIRHAGLLGFKYALAVRMDLVQDLLPLALPAIVQGLQDTDDDVRAVAADALVSVAGRVAGVVPQYVPTLLHILWNVLNDLDDLSASTSSVMNLLAELYSSPSSSSLHNLPLLNACSTQTSSSSQALVDLVPRLWPFFRHNVTAVRLAAVRTLDRLLDTGPSKWLLPILEPTLRYLFQNLLFEENPGVVQATQSAWDRALSRITNHDQSRLAGICSSLLPTFCSLAATAHGSAFDPALILQLPPLVRRGITDTAPTAPAPASHGKQQRNSKGHTQTQQGRTTTSHSLATTVSVVVEDYAAAVKIRIAAAIAIGSLACALPQQSVEGVERVLVTMLQSNVAAQRQVAGLILGEWAHNHDPSTRLLLSQNLRTRLLTMLEDGEAMVRVHAYAEVDRMVRKMRSEVSGMIAAFRNEGVQAATATPVETITAEASRALADTSFATWMKSVRHGGPCAEDCMHARLHALNKRLISTVGHLATLETQQHIGVMGSIASALVAIASCAENPSAATELPPKLTPLIVSLTSATRKEEHVLLRERATRALADLCAMCVNRKPCPNDKLIRNLCAMLCDDRSTIPDATLSVTSTDAGLASPPSTEPTLKRSTSTTAKKSAASANSAAEVLDSTIGLGVSIEGGAGNSNNSGARAANASTPVYNAEAVLARHGSEAALRAIARRMGAALVDLLPKFWEFICAPLYTVFGPNGDVLAFPPEVTVPARAKELIESLHVLTTILPDIHTTLYPKVLALLPHVFGCSQFPHAGVRTMAARCVAAACRTITARTMERVIDSLIPNLSRLDSINGRLGAAECLFHIIDGPCALGPALLPYIVFLIVPVLGRMSDSNAYVRQTMTRCFAVLVKLVPLELGKMEDSGMDEALVAAKQRERHFLEQLLDGSKLDPFPLPVKVNAELRKYQMDGVNWMAFLNKFHLHGILCDDMGLGKTLQTLCMVSSDHELRKREFAATGGKAGTAMPSLVVCPPTLCDHWYHECLKFVPHDVMLPKVYGGTPAARAIVRKAIEVDKFTGVVVTSYETVRSEAAFLSSVAWNYVVLDEGHIIKNPNTKLTKAVKSLNAAHRLLLSGTPIQNNVLELWSLFDFLMPGFLGTERQFTSQYAKPIFSSRDAKSSSAEKEAGILALDALHKQVLPFLLRRMKEDVLHDLPPKIIQDYYCELSPLQARLYEDFSRSQTKEAMETALVSYNKNTTSPSPSASSTTTTTGQKEGQGQGQPQHVFQALQYLRKLCNHPLLVLTEDHPHYTQVMADLRRNGQDIHDISFAPKLEALRQLLNDCGIGLSSNTTNSNSNNGNNNNSTRGDGTPTPVGPFSHEAAASGGGGGEGVVGQHRVLIFAQLKSMLDIIESDLFRPHMPSVTFMRLDGTVEPSKRHSVVQRFNSDPSIDVLLLTTHVGGLGLNLTGADIVIFVEHDWNPTKDLQAMDRAHRIGQKKVVNVYRLITRGTLEEKIMGLQQFKLSIANSVVNADNASLKTMDTGNVLDLFSLTPSAAALSTSDDAKKKQEQGSGGGGKMSAKAVLENLEELWDETQYDDLDIKSFLRTMT